MSEVAAVSVPTPGRAEAPRRVVLYGNASLYHDALKSFIETRSPNTSVAQVHDEKSLLEHGAAHVIVIDADLEKISDARIDEMAALVAKLAPRPVLLISQGIESAVLQQLLRAGVAGVMLESSSCESVLEAIDAVANGKVWLQRDLLSQTFGESSHGRRTCSEATRIAHLTERERELVVVACSGMTNRQIAQRLRISEATVRHHLSSIFAKLGVANRAELIVFGYRHRLVDEAERDHLC